MLPNFSMLDASSEVRKVATPLRVAPGIGPQAVLIVPELIARTLIGWHQEPLIVAPVTRVGATRGGRLIAKGPAYASTCTPRKPMPSETLVVTVREHLGVAAAYSRAACTRSGAG